MSTGETKSNNGGRKSTTWAKGQPPPVTKPKGTKHKSTLIKEALGLEGFDALKHYLGTEGAEHAINQLAALRGKTYIGEYTKLLEFVKPKLNRTTLSGDPDAPLQTQVASLEGLTFEQLMELKYGKKA